MSFSLVYLVQRLFYRVFDFLRDWYAGGFLWFSRHALNTLEVLDRFFALKLTFRYWLKPLYQDYTAVGYAVGFVFRTGRLIIGGLVYLVIAAATFALYLIWAVIPIYIIYKGFYGK